MKSRILDAIKSALGNFGGYGSPRLQPVPVRVNR